ncbi:MAG: DUF3617 family protein [Myxococcales bacterium]
MKRTTLAMAAALLLLGGSAHAAESKLPAKPGNWQLTMRVDSENLPQKLAPMTVEQCLTEAEMIPQAQQATQRCKPANPKITGNKVTWTIDCRDLRNGALTTGTGKATYAAESFEGVMDVKTRNVQLKYLLSGKRLGDCKKDAAKAAEPDQPAGEQPKK